jgi:hypothetical protein
MDTVEVYRFRAEEYVRLRELLLGFGFRPPQVPTGFIFEQIGNFVWRKTASAVHDDGSSGSRLEQFLDLGEGEGILLATFWAWDNECSGTGGKARKTEKILSRSHELQPLPGGRPGIVQQILWFFVQRSRNAF